MPCSYCGLILDDLYYKFCNVRCQWMHYQITEKKMNHLFHKSDSNDLCNICNRKWLDHTIAARCESCGLTGSCDIIDNLLLCTTCADRIKAKQFDLITLSRETDNAMRSRADMFNAKTMSNIALKESIYNDASITNKDEAYKNELLIRYEAFSSALFELDNERYDKQIELAVVKKSLDDIAHLIRKEERERIKIADANYVPPEKKKPVKVRLDNAVTKKESAFDKIVKMTMEMRGITETEAILMMKSRDIKSDK